MAVMQVPIPMMEISHAKGADKKQNKQTKKSRKKQKKKKQLLEHNSITILCILIPFFVHKAGFPGIVKASEKN